MPSIATLSSFYPADYHSFVAENWLHRKRLAMRVSRLGRALTGRSGAVLDYGCGAGAFLLAAARAFPERRFFGYEVSDATAIEDHLEGRVRIVRGPPDALWPELSALAVVCLNHVIEHLPEPAEIIQRLRAAVTSGGLIDGQTPRSDSLERQVFNSYWSGFHAPRHTVIFSRRGLKSLFDRCGINAVKIEPAFNPAGLAVSVGSVLHGDRPNTIARNGVTWAVLIAGGALLSPIDLLSGKSGIMDFSAIVR